MHVMHVDDTLIKPTSDLFIAALWSAPQNEPILRSLINGVLTDIGQPKIVKATVLNPFNVQDFPNDKEIRLDVRVEDETRKFYNIEVQRAWHTGFYNRSLYYWAETYESQIERGDLYKLLRPVRSIIITEFPVFPMLKQLHTVFELRSRENPDVLLTDHLQIHYLRVGNIDRQGLTGLDALYVVLQRWMQFLRYGSELEEEEMSAILQDVPEVHAAYGEYRRFKSDPVMREKAMARERFLTDMYLDRADAFAEGEAIGEARKARETASNMVQKGYAIAEIADLTGLSVSEIERLN
jgi:predicted transposase/invertase (TIGR01784 family)